MKTPFKIATIAVMLGSATAVVAQTPEQSFADTFAEMQALSSPAPTYHPAPSLSSKPAEPATRMTIAQMQALSSESPAWQLDHGRVDVSTGPTFAQTHPHGLPFELYQAASSDSGEFKLAPGPDVPAAYATAESINVATQARGPAAVAQTAKPSVRSN